MTNFDILIDDSSVKDFWSNGFVVLRGVIDPYLVLSMAGPISKAMSSDSTDLSELGSIVAPNSVLSDPNVSSKEGSGRFVAGTDHWVDNKEFANFACASVIPQIVGQILRSDSVWLYEDSVLVKEPNTAEETAFHQDLSYFHVSGEQICTVWVPLDFSSPETGAIRFVKGSHKDLTQYRPNWFVSDEPLPNTEGERVPQIPSEAVTAPTLSPGDITIHHARTLHGASANHSTDQSRRAISIRYCGDDARYHIREGAPLKSHHETVSNGDILTHEHCPKVWPRT